MSTKLPDVRNVGGNMTQKIRKTVKITKTGKTGKTGKMC